MQILIVDDDEFAQSILQDTLGRLGYSAVCAKDGREAMAILSRGDIRLMVTDWDMPEMNGLELCRAVRKADLPGYVYVIMLTGREGAKQRMEGLCAGADDFLNKPLDPEELLVCLKTSERILGLETREVALFALAKLAESRDSDTGTHIERVQTYTRILARNLKPAVRARHGIDDEAIRLLYQTSPLHDLGKVGIPDQVLLKPGRLTPDEFAVMKSHTLIGAQTLDAALQRFPTVRFLQMAREIAMSHHERFDGSGYPHGLVGEQIPISARIVAVADAYDAITSRRVYKQASTHEQAKQMLIRDSGSHFDPDVIASFLATEEQILAVHEEFRDITPLPRPALPLPTTPNTGTSPGAPISLLAVDDDPVVLARLVELLSATGESVGQATNGLEALRIVAEQQPKVIVSDWMMPGLDGVDLCRQLRLRGDGSPAHFIMLTAHSDKSRLLDAYGAGVDDFVVKPFDQEELLARVRAGLRSRKLHEEALHKANGSQALNAQLATVNSRLERLAITDELTGLFNRRHAMSRLEDQWGLAERYERPMTVIMLDVDHFKKINDVHGHDAGDVVLRRVAAILQDECRGTDTVCRIGGEEFLIILPAQSVQEAAVCAERCRTTIAAQAFPVHGALISVTISSGIASRTTETTGVSQLLKKADAALYSAKTAGRNCIRFADPTEKVAPVTPPFASPAPIDHQAVLKRCGGDTKFALAVTERFRKCAGVEMSRIDQSLASNDAPTLCRSAHSLKSMAAYVGCDSAVALAKQIEDLARDSILTTIAPLFELLKFQVDGVIASIDQAQARITAAENKPTPQNPPHMATVGSIRSGG